MEPTSCGSLQGDSELCPRCKAAHTIGHNGGRWCPRCGVFTTPPDPRLLAPIHNSSSSNLADPFGLRASKAEQADIIRCPLCFQPFEMLSGYYDDGEWFCGACFEQDTFQGAVTLEDWWATGMLMGVGQPGAK